MFVMGAKDASSASHFNTPMRHQIAGDAPLCRDVRRLSQFITEDFQ